MDDPIRPYRSVLESFEKTHRAFSLSEHLAKQAASLAHIVSAHDLKYLDNYNQFVKRLTPQLPDIAMRRTIAELEGVQQLAKSLLDPHKSAIASLSAQLQSWNNLIGPSLKLIEQQRSIERRFAELSRSAIVWENSTTRLVERFNEIGLMSRRLGLPSRLFASTDVFTAFSHSTLTRIEKAESERIGWALETSLRLAEDQLITTTDALDAVVAVPDDSDAVPEPRALQLPYAQQEQLLSAADEVEEGDTESLIAKSPLAHSATSAQQILLSATTCNQVRQTNGSEEIFKPTTRLLAVYADMPWLAPVDEKSFAEFVDCLYFLFYEGAGKDKLRFLQEYGGPISIDDFDFIECIKHLRNKWTRHDPDHGAETDIKKSRQQLDAKLRWLGLNRFPVSADDYRVLHTALLAKSNEFVQKILRGLSGQ
jgi:hypothetical protein